MERTVYMVKRRRRGRWSPQPSKSTFRTVDAALEYLRSVFSSEGATVTFVPCEQDSFMVDMSFGVGVGQTIRTGPYRVTAVRAGK
jgi:hypothetical protein